MKQKVYLMQNDFGLHKIGISSNPARRACEVSNSSGVPTKVLSVWEVYHAPRTEKELHKHFQKKRQAGEWFKLSKKDVKDISKLISCSDPLIPVKIVEPLVQPFKTCGIFSRFLVRKNFKCIEDVNAEGRFQEEQLKKICKKSPEEYREVILKLEEAGVVIPYWARHITNDSRSCYYRDGNIIQSPEIIHHKEDTPVIMSIWIREKIVWAEQALQAYRAELAQYEEGLCTT